MKLILACSFLLIFQGLVGQMTFSNNRDKFVREFDRSLNELGRSEFKDFTNKALPKLLLESSEFPDAYFNKMVETCNKMAAKNLKPYPETYHYVFSVYSFVKFKQSASSYQAFQTAVEKLLDGKNIKRFEEFIEFSAVFFSERKIAESANYSWYFEFSNVKAVTLFVESLTGMPKLKRINPLVIR